MALSVCDTSDVLVHFTLSLADGTVVESSRKQGKPALFRLGDDSLSAGLKQQLLGLKPGASKTFTLPPEAAFGLVNPDLIQYFSRRDFLSSGEPEPGVIMLFSGINGNQMPGVIQRVDGDSVTVDFNHPLAGKTVQFAIEVLEIDSVTESVNADLIG